MFIPGAIALLCQGFTAFRVANIFPPSIEERKPPVSPGENLRRPEGEQEHFHTRDKPESTATSAPPTVLFSASNSSESIPIKSGDSLSDVPAMAYPLSDMRNELYIQSMETEAVDTSFAASGYTPYLAHDDVFMDVAEPCNTSTPLKPKVSTAFSMRSTDEGMATDTSSSTVDLASPRSDTTTNITTPSTTNGSGFKTNFNVFDTPALEEPPRPRKVYPKPTYCSFFSSPHVENTERTRELWKHRLEIARRRAVTNNLLPSRGKVTSAELAHAAELKRKAGYVRRMDWIEHVTWEIPSEFEQYMFLLKLQAEEDQREVRKERERVAMRDGEDSDGSEVSYISSSPEYGEGEGFSMGQISGGVDEYEERDDSVVKGDYPNPMPSSRDIAEFGRTGEFEEMKMRLEELHRNARAFSVRPVFEEARTYGNEASGMGHGGSRGYGVDGMPGYI